ncbi:MAG: tRNA-binding protein [Actinomycetota bacterium]
MDARTSLPKKPDVTPEQFFALDLRAGRVVSVERFPEARKPSYKITVDFGSAVGERTTSAQTTHYSENELLGRMVVAAINLGTKKIAGFRSEFLILGALDPDGRVRLLRCEEGTLPGAPIA